MDAHNLFDTTTENNKPSFCSACQSLAEAFADDPFYQAITSDWSGQPEKRHQILAQYFGLAIEEANVVGAVEYSGDDGVAVWHTHKVNTAEAKKIYESRKSALSKLLGSAGFDNYLRISESMAKHIPNQLTRAWYLSILGVRPAARGQHLAQYLVDRTLRYADAQKATCFLETFNPLSLPFYKRLGFSQAMYCLEPITSRHYWLLARSPS